MSIVEKVQNIIGNEDYLKNSKKILSSENIDRYNYMLTNGIIKPRGNCLMPTTKLYTQNVMLNKKYI
nr:MAG TPA: Dengue 3 NS5 C-terminal NLS, NS5, Importin, PROTEIN TRANSPORT-Viral.1A [Caudoviricetes sp.]